MPCINPHRPCLLKLSLAPFVSQLTASITITLGYVTVFPHAQTVGSRADIQGGLVTISAESGNPRNRKYYSIFKGMYRLANYFNITYYSNHAFQLQRIYP